MTFMKQCMAGIAYVRNKIKTWIQWELNQLMVPFENTIKITFIWKRSWLAVSQVFCQSVISIKQIIIDEGYCLIEEHQKECLQPLYLLKVTFGRCIIIDYPMTWNSHSFLWAVMQWVWIKSKLTADICVLVCQHLHIYFAFNKSQRIYKH